MEHENHTQDTLTSTTKKLMDEVIKRMLGDRNHTRFPITSAAFIMLIKEYNKNPTPLNALRILHAYTEHIASRVEMTNRQVKTYKVITQALKTSNPNSEKITQCLLGIINFGYLGLETGKVQKPDGTSAVRVAARQPQVVQQPQVAQQPQQPQVAQQPQQPQQNPYNNNANADGNTGRKALIRDRSETTGCQR